MGNREREGKTAQKNSKNIKNNGRDRGTAGNHKTANSAGNAGNGRGGRNGRTGGESRNRRTDGAGGNSRSGGADRNRRTDGDGRNSRNGGRKREGGRSVFSTVMMVIAAGVFLFSLFQIAMMVVPYYTGGKEYDKVKEMAVTQPKADKDDKGSVDPEEGDDGFRVDFDALLAENPDTVAWIRLQEPAVISYPVVKGRDNEEYLTKTFSANDNKLGAIFLDVRSNPSFTDRNSFIYGHNLKVGGEMFSQLNAYADEAFCKQHPYFYIYTPDGTTKVYKVFSAGVVNAAADNYNITYRTEEDFLNYLQLCRDSSNYQVEVDLNESSRIVSLSTCTNVNEDERFLLQGVLVNER